MTYTLINLIGLLLRGTTLAVSFSIAHQPEATNIIPGADDTEASAKAIDRARSCPYQHGRKLAARRSKRRGRLRSRPFNGELGSSAGALVPTSDLGDSSQREYNVVAV